MHEHSAVTIVDRPQPASGGAQGRGRHAVLVVRLEAGARFQVTVNGQPLAPGTEAHVVLHDAPVRQLDAVATRVVETPGARRAGAKTIPVMP